MSMKYEIGDRIRRISNFQRWAPKGFESIVLKNNYYKDINGTNILIINEQWELISKPFVLPERWCIFKNKQEICDWFSKIGDSEYTLDFYASSYIHFPGKPNDRLDSFIRDGHTEITFEQFKEHVFKQNKMKKIIGIN